MIKTTKRTQTLKLQLRVCWILCILSIHFNKGLSQKIVTWNVKDLLNIAVVNSRKNDFEQFSRKLNPQILLIQEITSKEVTMEMAKIMGIQNYYFACSDFAYPDHPSRNAFELAILSKFPITKIWEYDPYPEKRTGNVQEYGFPDLTPYGIEKQRTNRGFLMVQIEKLKLFVVNVHLKSSVGKIGKADLPNALKREYVIAALAKTISELKNIYTGYEFVVGGDFNVGHSDNQKNGANLFVDCDDLTCEEKDGYDDTHAILKYGLIEDVCLMNLCNNMMFSSFPSFEGSPIDNFYYLGKLNNRKAKLEKNSYGSDHLPVWIRLRRFRF